MSDAKTAAIAGTIVALPRKLKLSKPEPVGNFLVAQQLYRLVHVFIFFFSCVSTKATDKLTNSIK